MNRDTIDPPCKVLLRPITGIRVEPPFGHFYSLGPSGVHLVAIVLGDLWLEDGSVLFVDLLEFFKLSPDVDSEAGNNRRTKSCSLAHKGSVHWNTDDICLGLL